MKTNGNYADTVAKWADKLKKQSTSTPLQEVRPFHSPVIVTPMAETPTPKSKEPQKMGAVSKQVRVNFNADEQLMERVWIYSAKTKKSLKQIATLALTEYLDRNQPLVV
ncbi:hypothetical protein GCM10027299_52330 [Larkinella ripae]